MQSIHTPNQESLFLDYVRRLEHHRQGRQFVHFHLSKLKPFNRREHHIRIAADAFDHLVKDLQGQLFTLQNSDIIFIFKAEAMGQVEEAVEKLRFLFGDDPLLTRADDHLSGFCTWMDVETDYEEILAQARHLATSEPLGGGMRRGIQDARSAIIAKQEEGEPLSPRTLGRIEEALSAADLTNMVRRQYVCGLTGPQNVPRTEFSELFISINDLRETLLPDVNFTVSPWLFNHLTETLDRRILAMLGKTEERDITGDISVNLNVSTILSPEFLQFDDNVIAAMRGNIVIELQKHDIFSDLNAYLFAREYTKSRGYRICIDGITHDALAFVDRERLGADLMKIVWNPDFANGAQGLIDKVHRHVMKTGGNRVILCRCDTQEAIDFGKSIGIELFQGRHVENLIAEENRRRNLRMMKARTKRS